MFEDLRELIPWKFPPVFSFEIVPGGPKEAAEVPLLHKLIRLTSERVLSTSGTGTNWLFQL